MSEPLDLEPIKARDAVYSTPLPPTQLRGGVRGVMDQMIADRRALLAEVERLRAELARRDEEVDRLTALVVDRQDTASSWRLKAQKTEARLARRDEQITAMQEATRYWNEDSLDRLLDILHNWGAS